MQGGSKLRISLVTGAIAIAALVYMLPKQPAPKAPTGKVPEESSHTGTFSFDKLVTDSKKELEPPMQTKITGWEEELTKAESPVTLYDSIGNLWDLSKKPGVSAWYFEKK